MPAPRKQGAPPPIQRACRSPRDMAMVDAGARWAPRASISMPGAGRDEGGAGLRAALAAAGCIFHGRRMMGESECQTFPARRFMRRRCCLACRDALAGRFISGQPSARGKMLPTMRLLPMR